MPSTELRRRVRNGALMVLLVLSATCDDDNLVSSDLREFAGLYVATQFVTEMDGVVADQLARGSTVTLSLDPSSITSGRLIISDPVSPVDAGLEGRWALFIDHLQLDLVYDTILNGMIFDIRGNTLVADHSEANQRIRLVLTRQ